MNCFRLNARMIIQCCAPKFYKNKEAIDRLRMYLNLYYQTILDKDSLQKKILRVHEFSMDYEYTSIPTILIKKDANLIDFDECGWIWIRGDEFAKAFIESQAIVDSRL